MALTENQKSMIRAVAQNDIKLAKKCAVACATEDTTAKNRWFCEEYKSRLETQGVAIELPGDLQGILNLENVSAFREERYFLSEREQAVYKNIVRMKKVGGRLEGMGIPYLNSTLLFGESGTGKTTFGKYVAHKMGLPFCYLNFTYLVDSLLGGTSKNINKAFSFAAANPCVLMLDEIDCISIRRSGTKSSGGTGGEMARITISLMQEFDGLANGVILIAATNRKDRMDEALLRRFSLIHEVAPLTEVEMETMIRNFINNVGMSLTDDEIQALVESSGNQSLVMGGLIRIIASKIEEDIDVQSS